MNISITSKIQNSILIILPPLLSAFLLKSTFGYFFFQDDWFNFDITNISSFSGYLSFFRFREDIIAYRPIGLQTFFYIFRLVFDLNSFAIRLINFSLLFGTYILVINLAHKLGLSKKASLFASSLWILSSFQFMNVGAINYNLLGTFFWISTFVCLTNFLTSKKIIYYLFSILIFVISLGIFELAVTFPIIYICYLLILKKEKLPDAVKIMFIYFLVTTVFVFLRQLNIAKLYVTEYEMAIDFRTLKNLFWYVVWLLNVPEEFKKQVVDKVIIFNSIFIKEFYGLVVRTFLGVIIFVSFAIIYPIASIYKNKIPVEKTFLLFVIIWFFITLAPPLVLVNHTFIMYLTLPSIPIYLYISKLIFLSNKRLLPVLVIIIWTLLSYSTTNFYSKNFFWVNAQKTSRNFIQDLNSSVTKPRDNSIIVYELSSKEDKQAVFEQHAARALFRNDTLTTVFDYNSLKSKIISSKKEFTNIYFINKKFKRD